MTVPSPEGLIALARAAREQAYAPYSHFAVGAAVLAADGRMFGGCNIENASYGLTMCAERVALFAAVAAGVRQISAVAVVAGAGAPAMPCGACRQALAEFGRPDTIMLLASADADRPPVQTTLEALFPHPFTLTPGL